MSTQLRIIMGAAGSEAEPTLHLALEAAGVGQVDGESQPPFPPADLSVLLRVLELNRSTQNYFAAEEVERLRAWEVVATPELKADDRGWLLLTESDLNLDKLLTLVQSQLYLTLFPTEVQRNALAGALAGVPPKEALHLRLELPAGGPNPRQAANVSLFQYPWEVLSYANALWQGRRVSFSRYIRYGQPVSEPKLVERLNVLLVTARPADLPRGEGDDRENITAGLNQALADSRVHLAELASATTEALSDYLFDHSGLADPPHVLHFDGHGDFGRRCPAGHFNSSASANRCQVEGCNRLLTEQFAGYLAFERADGRTHWVSGEELADLLRDHDLKLVVLNACKSGLGRRGEDVFNGVAQSLMRSVPAVVATPFRLDWSAALRFARYFYQGLAQGQPLVEALDRTRQRLRSLAETPREWYRPVLYLRQGDDGGGWLFKPLPTPGESEVSSLPDVPAEAVSVEMLRQAKEADLVYIHNFDDLPADIAAAAQVLDWSAHFNRTATPRQMPAPPQWEKTLLPELRQLRANLGRRGLVRLRSSGALSVGFAFGHTFMEVGQYRLEVGQSPPTPPLLWLSDEPVPTGRSPVTFASRRLAGNQAATDGVVIIYAVPRRSPESVVGPVEAYWGEGNLWAELVTQAKPRVDYNEEALKLLLVEGFSDDELRDLCYYNPSFRPVYDKLAGVTGKAEIVRQLITFTHQQVLFEELLGLVKTNNPRRYALHEDSLRQLQTHSQKFKGVLLLEAEAAAKEGRFIEGWEAASLARSSRRLLLDFVSQVQPQKLHLFLAVPFALAVFLGHQWNAIGGLPMQCYEWVGGESAYAPACLLDLN